MQNRRKKIARILEVRRQMHRIEEWKLAHIARRGVALGEEQVALVEALNQPGDFQALFADSLARRLNRLSLEAAHVASEEAAQSQRLMAEARYLKTAERLSEKVEKQARRESEKLEFRAILETLNSADDASSA
ncbi:hypothetical protein [Afifella sp. IM 167]|uniref:hypothetical protein n=1 Tax=Afifella sp. IM 167 TaxID=2033586 RepID=UPI001CCE97E0|nr:hypothetical protein [Afifella sp. IM 167]MBZ8131806.1 hypothetical protein [Afifella sp. IM 167]